MLIIIFLLKEMPFGRRFARDISKMAKHMERLFQQNAEHFANKKAKGNYSNESKNEKTETKMPQKMKFCARNEVHNFLHNILINQLEKMRVATGGDSSSAATNETPKEEQPEPQRSSSTADECPIYEEQKKFANTLTNGIKTILGPMGNCIFIHSFFYIN